MNISTTDIDADIRINERIDAWIGRINLDLYVARTQNLP